MFKKHPFKVGDKVIRKEGPDGVLTVEECFWDSGEARVVLVGNAGWHHRATLYEKVREPVVEVLY